MTRQEGVKDWKVINFHFVTPKAQWYVQMLKSGKTLLAIKDLW